MADALCVDDQMMYLALLAAGNNMVDNFLLIVIIILRKQNILRAVGDTAPECNIPRMPSHNLNDTAALMGGGSVLHLVNGLHGGVDRSVKTNGVLCAGNVQVDCAGNAYGIDSQSGQSPGSPVGAVAANHDNTVYPMFLTDFRALLLILRLLELQAPGRAQNRTSPLDDVGHVPGLHVDNILIQQTVVTLLNSLDLQPSIDSGTDHCADGSVHARRIPSACQNSNSLQFVGHCQTSLTFLASYL